MKHVRFPTSSRPTDKSGHDCQSWYQTSMQLIDRQCPEPVLVGSVMFFDRPWLGPSECKGNQARDELFSDTSLQLAYQPHRPGGVPFSWQQKHKKFLCPVVQLISFTTPSKSIDKELLVAGTDHTIEASQYFGFGILVYPNPDSETDLRDSYFCLCLLIICC
jgi:hypothetical protein